MKSIYKYPINIHKEDFGVDGPITKILTVQMQHGKPYVWAEVDTDAPIRHFAVFPIGTGWNLGEINNFEKATYLNTIQEFDGDLIWHMYYWELTEPFSAITRDYMASR